MKPRCNCHPQSAFRWSEAGYVGDIRWADLNKAKIASERSSGVVNAKRATGVDMATVHGLSNNVRDLKLDPKHFHVFMKAVISGKN